MLLSINIVTSQNPPLYPEGLAALVHLHPTAQVVLLFPTNYCQLMILRVFAAHTMQTDHCRCAHRRVGKSESHYRLQNAAAGLLNQCS